MNSILTTPLQTANGAKYEVAFLVGLMTILLTMLIGYLSLAYIINKDTFNQTLNQSQNHDFENSKSFDELFV